MLVLTLFAFLAGLVTILSPCILPILPIILSSSLDGKAIGKARPIGVVAGFIASFTFFTLFLSTLVQAIGLSADILRFVSVGVIALMGVSFLIPQVQLWIEQQTAKLTRFVPQGNANPGFIAGVVVGLSLGLLWTPCVGPILASVISLAITGTVTLDSAIITLAYAAGTAVPMFLIIQGGQTALRKVPWLLAHLAKIQKGFGVVMILVAVAIATNADRSFQSFVLTQFPQYGAGLTKFEDIQPIQNRLEKLSGNPVQSKGAMAPELIPGGEWFNSQPLTLAELKGKVVLVDFWTYSCINCQRTLPYLKSWWEKYHDKGLVIIGVHSPEFEFEKLPKNVAQAIADFEIPYPVMQDNQFTTWKAYSNHYWPAKYFIDKDGNVRHSHFGEGDYDTSERVIQQLLMEAGAQNVTDKPSNLELPNYARTPETYLGYDRMDNFASPERVSPNKPVSYTVPNKLYNNEFAFSGVWTVRAESAFPNKGASLTYNFDAKEVYLVMKNTGQPAEVQVTLDGTTEFLGADVNNGKVIIDADRLYRLVKLDKPGKHTLKLEFSDSNAEVFAFTFG
jgi:cytochrome c biogenesis protein CcdA/thiol-disulfide isomerase/thioredoxin